MRRYRCSLRIAADDQRVDAVDEEHRGLAVERCRHAEAGENDRLKHLPRVHPRLAIRPRRSGRRADETPFPARWRCDTTTSASTSVPSVRRTPVARPSETRISSTVVFTTRVPPSRSIAIDRAHRGIVPCRLPAARAIRAPDSRGRTTGTASGVSGGSRRRNNARSRGLFRFSLIHVPSGLRKWTKSRRCAGAPRCRAAGRSALASSGGRSTCGFKSAMRSAPSNRRASSSASSGADCTQGVLRASQVGCAASPPSCRGHRGTS